MKVKDIINESNYENFEKEVKRFKQRFPDFIMFHGSESDFITGELQSFEFRKYPLDTPPVINFLINEHLNNDFGVPIRNLLYITQNAEVADHYGQVYAIIPKGNYRLFYAEEIEDFSQILEDFSENIPKIAYKKLSHEFSKNDAERIQDLINKNFALYFKELFYADSMHSIEKSFDEIPIGNDEDYKIAYRFHQIMVEELLHSVKVFYDDNYANNIVEITSKSDIPSKNIEMMGYFPDGFYTIKYNDIEDYFDTSSL